MNANIFFNQFYSFNEFYSFDYTYIIKSLDSTIKVKTKLKLELLFKLLGIYFRTLKLRISRQKVERRKWKNTGENKKFADEY